MSMLGVVGRLRKPQESPAWVAAVEKARGEREVEGCVWWGWGVVRLCWVLGGLSLASLPFFFFNFGGWEGSGLSGAGRPKISFDFVSCLRACVLFFFFSCFLLN